MILNISILFRTFFLVALTRFFFYWHQLLFHFFKIPGETLQLRTYAMMMFVSRDVLIFLRDVLISLQYSITYFPRNKRISIQIRLLFYIVSHYINWFQTMVIDPIRILNCHMLPKYNEKMNCPPFIFIYFFSTSLNKLLLWTTKLYICKFAH